jgi:predicted HicB family RNase H-like nuclease
MSDESTEIPTTQYLPPEGSQIEEEPEAEVEEETESVSLDDLDGFLAEMEEIEASMEAEPEPEPEPVVQHDPMVAAAELVEKIHQQEVDDAQKEVDNVEAAMDKVAETLDHTISSKISDDDGPADKQILIRSTVRDHERWKLAAEREGKSLSAFVRDIVNVGVTEILDCSHPPEYRQTYPWSDSCLKCGTRLWEKGDTHLTNRR